MKEHPILFRPSMVRALLAGTKTQTRRVLKPRRDREMGCDLAPHELAGEINSGNYRNSTWAPGDELWVKEAIRLEPNLVNSTYVADGCPTRADDWPWKLRGLPAMFCPRGLSRIQLKITGVRAQRLLDISTADSIAEGLSSTVSLSGSKLYGIPELLPGNQIDMDGWPGQLWSASPVHAYMRLWNKINGTGPLFSSENPWVVALTFERISHD